MRKIQKMNLQNKMANQANSMGQRMKDQEQLMMARQQDELENYKKGLEKSQEKE